MVARRGTKKASRAAPSAQRRRAKPNGKARATPSQASWPDEVPSDPAAQWPPADPAYPPFTVVVQQQQQQEPAGPWYACGLGGTMLATNAALFFFLVALTYSAGLAIMAFLVLLLASMGNRSSSSSSGCSCNEGCGSCCSDCNDCDCGTCCDCDCGDCGDCGCSTMAIAALPALVLAPGVLAARARRGDFAHHPDTPAFHADTYRIAGTRWCIGCFTTYPLFLAASTALALGLMDLAWGEALAFGLGLALLQAVSSLGWTRWRAAKVAVKTALGLGLALAVHGVLQAPWPRLAQVAALAAMLGLAALSARPRRRRIARAAYSGPGPSPPACARTWPVSPALPPQAPTRAACAHAAPSEAGPNLRRR